MTQTPMEIMAPAGGEESLIAAVACGADAVYLGGSELNARRGAQNFDQDRLAWAVSYCHARSVKVYLAVNTLVLERELALLRDTLRCACAIGVDAIIATDLAVAALARQACPELPLFASTQMAVTGLQGALALQEMGFSRLVLARELTLEEIRSISNGCDIGLEIFVHGALCMGVSGQCYLSAIIGGRSGNRGLCAQPCRLPFAYNGHTHALSLKDLSLIDRLPELAAAGVVSLKIEGRMKRPEYVAGAVSACRAALSGRPFDLDELAALFSRSGFTQGYLDGKRGAQMFGSRRKEDVTAASPALLGKYAALYQKEHQCAAVDLRLTLRPDEPASLEAIDADGNAATVTWAVPSPALTAPTDAKKAVAALSKTGSTIFYPRQIECDISPGLYLAAAELNALRRDALAGLMDIREQPRPIPFCEDAAQRMLSLTPARRTAAHPQMRLRLERASQLSGLEHTDAAMISLPVDQLEILPGDKFARFKGILAAELPKFEFGSDSGLPGRLARLREKGITQAVCGSLGAIRTAAQAGLAAHGDFSLNIANTIALKQYAALGLASVTLSFEVALASAKILGGELPRGVIAYGHLPLMHLRNCPVRAQGGCRGNNYECPSLQDRKGKRFPLCCVGNITTLHNCVPLWMGDKRGDLAGFDFLTLYFTSEPPGRITEITRLFSQGAQPSEEHTRGLYYRVIK